MFMETKCNSFAQRFRECCLQSCSRLANEREKNDEEYFFATQDCKRLYQIIEEKLGEERKLIDKFDAAKNYYYSFSEEYIYQQGFQDCVYLLRWIGLL